MPTYKVQRSQNIYDVAVAVYGSVEGLFDLLVSNSGLSLDSELVEGQGLYWNEAFVVHQSIVDAMASSGIVPTNGERGVYYKETDKELRCVIQVNADESAVSLLMSGDGTMTVDWGDNTDFEDIPLQPEMQTYKHFFDNDTDKRIIRLYGDFNIKTWDLSPISGLLLPTTQIVVDEVEMRANKIPIQGLFLFKGTYSVIMNSVSVTDLAPIQDMSLSYLELNGVSFDTDGALDSYLIYVAKNNNMRRNCTVTTDQQPSGTYQEPEKDENGNYVITSGMEAIYVITHEDAWNEAGPWVFNICGDVYQYENNEVA